MAIADLLRNIGTGVEKGAKVAGAVLEPVAKRTAEVVSGEAPQIDEEQRKLQTQGIEARAQQLESQLEMGRKYGTLTPDQQKQYVDEITKLYSHPSQMGTLVQKLHKAVHPGGATYQAPPLANATPKGGTQSADEANAEKLALARQSTKPLPKDAAFLEAYAHSLGKTWQELTPDEMVDAYNKEGETKAAQDKEAHQKALEDYRDATLQLRKSEEALHEAQFKASQDPNNPKFKLEAEKARTAAMRDEAYWIRAQANVFGEVNGKPLPGALLTGSGDPVGSSFQGNVKPTGQEIGRTDLAISTLEQIGDVRGIIDKRPDMFGPGAGRGTDFTVWLGSQGPDAQRMKAAISTISSHLAGVFGSRSKYAQEEIARVIGQFRTNPDALKAALDQYQKAAETIQSKGVRHVVGGMPTDKSPHAAPVNPGAVIPKTGAQPVSDDQFLMQVK